jgi:hypothetical protein
MKDDLESQLAVGLELACQCQHIRTISAGRRAIVDLPRPWVLGNLLRVAGEALNLSDEWEYRRLLEVCELINAGLPAALIHQGRGSVNAEVREAAEDFSETGRRCT